jgi:hypothetical protein
VKILVLVITGAAADLGRIVFEKCHDHVVREPLALDAVIVDVVTQS